MPNVKSGWTDFCSARWKFDGSTSKKFRRIGHLWDCEMEITSVELCERFALGNDIDAGMANKEAGSGMPDPASSSVSGCGELCR
jgi:hypothetical protein